MIALSLVFSIGPAEPKNRKIAEELLELHRQWDTATNIPSLYTSLTNLPFHRGSAQIANGNVSRRYNVLGLKLEQVYFIAPAGDQRITGWTLYHAWYWYPPPRGMKQLSTRELVTITNE